jgi:hypothetical protein
MRRLLLYRRNHSVARSRVGVVLACAILASVVGSCCVALASTSSPVHPVAMVNLPRNDQFDGVAVVNGRVTLYGPAPSLEYPSASSTCSFAVVTPGTLALSDVRHASCADPAAFGRSVIPAVSIDKDLPARGGGPSAVVRIARVIAGSPGYALGPIVMTFSALAFWQTRPTWIYGDGDLWLYDWVNRFDLLRISATTGAVLQRLVVPEIQTPLLAFNDDGLWIAPYGESSGPLYRLAPGATKVSAVFDLGSGDFAWWLVAAGDSVWLDAQPRPVTRVSTIWHLRGPNADPLWHEPASPILQSESDGVTAGGSATLGNNAGLWTVVFRKSGAQQVIRIDPSTGKLAIVATLTPQAVGPSPGLWSLQAATVAGSLFLLDRPMAGTAKQADRVQFSTLYRITPSES